MLPPDCDGIRYEYWDFFSLNGGRAERGQGLAHPNLPAIGPNWSQKELPKNNEGYTKQHGWQDIYWFSVLILLWFFYHPTKFIATFTWDCPMPSYANFFGQNMTKNNPW